MKCSLKLLILISSIMVLVLLFRVYSQDYYFGQNPPGDSAIVFAPGIISQEGRFEECIAFSPDGEEICVDITNSGWNSFTIYHCEFDGENWSELAVADFVSGNNNCASHYTPDGSKFIFTSGSPRNVYSIDISENGYGSPVKIPSPVSSSEDEWHATFSLNNTLYFHSHRNGAFGGIHDADIYYSIPNEGNYDTVYHLGRPVSSTAKDADPFISPDEDYMLFNSTRSDGFGYHDLFVSFKKENGSWTNPKNLGDKINTNQKDIWASVSPDGKYIFFTRRTENSESDIYWVSSSIIDDLKNTNYLPYVLNGIPDQACTVGDSFYYSIPDTVFIDDDGNETLALSAKLSNGDELPEWLNFDPQTQTFSGTPAEEGLTNLKITATDTAGANVYDIFKLSIEKLVGIEQINDNTSTSSFVLNQNYPNPFNPTTTISYQLPVFSNVRLVIYNTLGQEIKTLVNSYQNAGKHSIVWDAMDNNNNSVSSGIYFYQLKTNQQIQQKKMFLIQ